MALFRQETMLGLEPVVRSYIAWTVRERGRLGLEVLADVWPIVVGRAIAARTAPKALRGRRLDVAVPDSVWAADLRFSGERILGRLNALLPEGVRPFEAIRFSVGGSPVYVPEGSPVAEPAAAIPLTEEQRAALDDIPDPELRAIVARVVERDSGRLNRDESGEDAG